ncbi:hypothetical protein [Haloferula sp.]|uniref:hypothetical protein n=1 Tax=Haloferula sp. TaxID=2497595 RepID=UPI003C7428D1
MKHINLLLLLIVTTITIVLLWQGAQTREKESQLLEVISRHSKASDPSKSSDLTRNSAPGGAARPSAAAFEPDHFLTELNSLLDSAGTDSRTVQRAMRMFLFDNKGKLASASPKALKEACNKIEADWATDAKSFVWLELVSEIVKSDPAWAIRNIDRFLMTIAKEQPMEKMLHYLGKNGRLGDPAWSPEYAAELEKWFDTAEADGRLKGMDEEAAGMRFDLNISLGNLLGAVEQLTHLPEDSLSTRLEDLAASSSAPSGQRGLVEAVAAAVPATDFQDFTRALSQHAGFDSARELLARAELTAERHDLAAAGIAAADIGPQTAARADWLITTLRDKDAGAVTGFAAAWTQAAHKDTAAWLTSLPAGDARDAAVAGFAPAIARLDGATAAKWGLTLENPSLRTSVMDHVYREWHQQEPEAAAEYFGR